LDIIGVAETVEAGAAGLSVAAEIVWNSEAAAGDSTYSDATYAVIAIVRIKARRNGDSDDF
jgi:hypothetical protein